jgi:hypothetical protein
MATKKVVKAPTTPDWNGPLPKTKTAKVAPPPDQSLDNTKMAYWQKNLATPITAEIGLSDQERQGIYNLARRQGQGATNAAAGELEQKMGGRGFTAGDSGIADTALGKIYGAGAEQLGAFGQTIALDEAKNRFAQNMDLSNANLNRMSTGGNIALGQFSSENQLRAAQAQASAQVQAARIGAESDTARLALDKEKFAEDTRRYGLDAAEEIRKYNQNFGENQRQYDTTFGEGKRQYDVGFGENQRQYNTTFGEGQRQYNQNYGENVRQYNQGFDVSEQQRNIDNIMRMYQMQSGYEQQIYTPYYEAMGGAANA